MINKILPKSLFKPRFLTLNIKIARFIHPAINEANSLDSDYLSKDNYDIVINGGGIVGFSMFAAIKCSPFLSSKRVLLIEQQSKPRFPDEDLESNERKFSNRVSSITLSSKQFFEELKIWHTLQPYAKKVQGMYVWSDHYQNGVNFTSDTFTDSICYVLENNRMLKALYNRITENNEEQNDDSLQKILYKTSVIDIDQTIDIENKTPSIQLKILDITDPEQKSKYIRTKLLIGCDGFKSIVRLKSGLPYFEMDLDQMGIVATMKIVSHNPGNHIAYQRFISDQLVIALLPLDEHHSSLVLSVPKKCAADWMKIPDKEFVSKLNNELIRETVVQKPLDKLSSAFNLKQLYNIIQIKSPPTIESIVSGSRASFPLGFGTTVPFMVGTIEPKVPLMKALISKDKRVNTAIIGDAAHRIHPLAGQGLNLGLGDASILASCLDSKLSAGYEIFGSTADSIEVMSQALYEFERYRTLKLIPMMGAIQSMQTFFKYTPSAILPIFNQLDLAKKLIVSFANSR